MKTRDGRRYWHFLFSALSKFQGTASVDARVSTIEAWRALLGKFLDMWGLLQASSARQLWVGVSLSFFFLSRTLYPRGVHSMDDESCFCFFLSWIVMDCLSEPICLWVMLKLKSLQGRNGPNPLSEIQINAFQVQSLGNYQCNLLQPDWMAEVSFMFFICSGMQRGIISMVLNPASINLRNLVYGI